MKSCFEDLRSKAFQWGKKDFGVKKRTKKGPVIELLRTFVVISVITLKGFKKRVFTISHTTKVRMFIVVGHNKQKVW